MSYYRTLTYFPKNTPSAATASWLSDAVTVWSSFQANLCFVDIDNRSIELPEDFPQFPNKTEFIQELSEVLLSFGSSGEAGLPPRAHRSPSSTPSTPSGRREAVALRQLEDDGRNGNLAGEELGALLQGNATLERLQALSRRTGVALRVAEGPGGRAAAEEEELTNAKLNVQLREVFAGRFATMFADYEAFVIQSAPDLESWLTNREQMHNFDKVIVHVTAHHTRLHSVADLLSIVPGPGLLPVRSARALPALPVPLH